MTTAILAVLGAAWLWHVIDLFRSVDVDTLPPRARRRLAARVTPPEAATELPRERPQLRLVRPRTAS